MLLNDFFIIDDWQPAIAAGGNGLDSSGYTAGSARALLRINWRHPILEGHFPGRPVVPGACLLQLVKELLLMGTGGEARLIRADQIKFISMIAPDLNEIVWMNITWNPSPASNVWQVTAEGTHADEIFFRFKGSFQAGSDYAG